jgi:Nitrous oxidase accessory protein
MLASTLLLFCLSVEVNAESAHVIHVPRDYPTLTAALANAAFGDTIELAAGTYNEQTIAVNKTVKIHGENPQTTILLLHPQLYFIGFETIEPSYTYQTSITVNANSTEFSGLTINTQLSNGPPADYAQHDWSKQLIGVSSYPRFTLVGGTEFSVKADNVTVKNCVTDTRLTIDGSFCQVIDNSLSAGIKSKGLFNQIIGNSFSNYGITVTGDNCTVHDNILDGGSTPNQDGILAQGTYNLIFHNNITRFNCGVSVNNNVGDRLYGVASGNVFYGNRITKNIYGVSVYGDNLNNTFYANDLVNNSVSLSVGSNTGLPQVLFFHNNFIGAIVQVQHSKPATVTSDAFNVSGTFDNGLEGNYWSDYSGDDLNGDGIGDTGYVIDEYRQDHYPLMTPFNITSASLELAPWYQPAQQPYFPWLWVGLGVATLVICIVSVLVTLVFRGRKQVNPELSASLSKV